MTPRRPRDEYENAGIKVGGFVGRMWGKVPFKVRMWIITASIAALLGAGGSAATGITPYQLLKAPGEIIRILKQIQADQRALYVNQVTTLRIISKMSEYDSAEAEVLEENRAARRRAKRQREIFGDPMVDPDPALTPFDPSKGITAHDISGRGSMFQGRDR